MLAGFSVSLVALPLSIGVALAMNLPPQALLAGIFAAIVGGVFTSFIRSGNVSINGPSPALIGIVIAGMSTLGSWEYMLAAFVCAGILQALFGVFKLGGLADFIPSSVVQGMMAAIGVIILAGQIHPGLGVEIGKMNDFEKLLAIPSSLANMNPLIAIIFFNSLIILAVHPQVTNRFIKYVPAPIWLLLFAIPLYVLFQYSLDGHITLFGGNHSLNPTKDLINFELPHDIVNDLLVFPNFGKVSTVSFWLVVLSVFLVSTIETLGSAKAIDKIDPLKRKTNLNRDVTAMGISTILSGFIGGLPVIAVIARSSVNINHGAKTKFSNFVHGVLILLFVFLLSDYIKMVPKAALMAILVFTGYKLASPKVFKDASLKGYEQFLILTVTLVSTLLTDLNKGILIGILFTVVIHLVRSHLPATLFFKYLAKPYFNLAKIEDHFHLKIKGVANFVSILKLRKVLAQLPDNEKVVFDFARTRLVDFSMLEFVNNWGKDYKTDRGGRYDIIGLDEHLTTSEHPFGIHALPQTVSKPLSKRQQELKEFAFKNGWGFDPKLDWNTDYLTTNTFFETRPIEYLKNRLSGVLPCKANWELVDITFDEGALMAAEVHNMSMLLIQFDGDIPDFELDKEQLFNRLLDFAIKEDIDLDKEFDTKFSVKGKDKTAIKQFFTKDLRQFIKNNDKYHVESTNNTVLVFRYFRVMSVSEIEELLAFGEQLSLQFQNCLAAPIETP
ncbi:SulP family inorganic anion transporter [Bacteroidia bacterium]|nr:SulP family inorganic anion transporter [Bacteroidota bacterium]MDA8930664.1 SulP family inorganic anion transporter [Bacteroidia bacterium]MDA9110756.1 SulP family inorganic anion transporter [Bacteroidia bacterium]